MGDLISQLPNDLLHKILLNLRTSESVRTSVLSTRWRHLWQSVPGLIFDGIERDVLDFTDRFLNLHRESPIYKFTIMCSRVDIPRWKLLIDQVLTRQVQFLKINCLHMIKLPVRFYMCETLVNLHLEHSKLDDFDCIRLPHLQVMHLQSVWISSGVVLEMLISCSPILQELRLCNMNWKRVKLRSQTLRSLSLTSIGSGVVIDTPNLEFLRIRDQLLENLRVESVSSSIKICIGIHFKYEKDDFSKMQTLHDFFTGISCVTDLSISGYTLYGIYNTYPPVRQYQQLPEFKNLTRLYACFCASYLNMLPLFLSGCPILKSMALELCYSPKIQKIANFPVPQCLQTSIKNVKIKSRLMGDKERSPKLETEFAKYILENAKALKKLTLWLDDEEDVCRNVLEQILTFRDRPSVDVMIHQVTSNCRTGYTFD